MEARKIKRYKDKSVPELIEIAKRHFNKFIRERDKDKGCISCGAQVQEAGHYYSGGHYPELRFNEDNVNGQCKKCNRHLHGNLIEYRKRLEQRIGIEQLVKLDQITEGFKRIGFKWDRFYLIEVILKYIEKNSS